MGEINVLWQKALLSSDAREEFFIKGINCQYVQGDDETVENHIYTEYVSKQFDDFGNFAD